MHNNGDVYGSDGYFNTYTFLREARRVILTHAGLPFTDYSDDDDDDDVVLDDNVSSDGKDDDDNSVGDDGKGDDDDDIGVGHHTIVPDQSPMFLLLCPTLIHLPVHPDDAVMQVRWYSHSCW
jgi:hypothetical protein